MTSSTATDLIVTQRSGAVAFIAINRPEKKNALTLAMYEALTAAITQAERDPAIRVILIHGRGDSFTAGNDIGDFAHSTATSTDSPPVHFFRAISQASKPIVAAVHGYAVGIGTSWCPSMMAVGSYGRRSAVPYTLTRRRNWRRVAPHLGEHTEQILNELGFDPGTIANLRTAGAIARPAMEG